MSSVATRGTVPRKALAKGRQVGRPMFDALLGEPFEEGRLRLAGTSFLERQLAITGLVVLFGLLASLLLVDLWREGGLIPLADTTGRWTFVPRAFFPVALVAFTIGWLVFLWGGLRASLPIRILAVVAFLLLNGSISKPFASGVGDSLAFRYGPQVGRGGYFAVAGLIVLYSILEAASRTWARRLRPLFLILLAGSLVALFGSLLAISLESSRLGTQQGVLLTLNGTVQTIAQILEPVIILSVVALVDFAYSASESVTVPARELRTTWLKVAVAAVIGWKIWIQALDVDLLPPRIHLGVQQWLADDFHVDPWFWAPVTIGLVLFAAIGWWWRRSIRGRASEQQVEEAKEGVIYAGLAAEALVAIVVALLFSLADAVFTQTESPSVFRVFGKLAVFSDRHSLQARTAPWVILALVGAVLLASRRTRERRRELGLGLLLLGVWNAPFFILANYHQHFDFDYQAMDVVLTLAIAVALVVRWRHIDKGEALALLGLVVFSWLLFARGDFISSVSGFLHPPTTLVLVFGLVYTLLADSRQASGDSRRLPRDSRVLLYVGYLVLSVTILNWVQVTHPASHIQDTIAANAFGDISIPFAAWLVIRRPRTRREAEAAALPTEVGAFELEEGR